MIGVSFTLVLTAVFLFLAFRKVDFGKAFLIISDSSLLILIVYLIIFFLSHYARAIRWKLMLDPVKKDISKNHLFGSVMISYGVSCIVPRLGEIYRALFLGRWENIPRATVLGTIVVERIFDVTFFTLGMLVSVFIYNGDLYKEVEWLRLTLLIGFGLVFVAVIIIFLIIRFQNKFTNMIVSLTAKINEKLSQKLKVVFETLVDGFSTIKSGKHFAGITIWSLTIMLLYAVNTYVGFFMINMHQHGEIDFTTAWVFMSLSAIGFIIPTPSGLGSYHALAIFTLVQLFNCDYNASAAYAILTHLIQTVCFVGSTIFILFFLNKKRVKQGLSKETFLSVLKSNPESK